MTAVDFASEEEFVLELALALERAGVHKLDGNRLISVGEGSAVDGAESALAKAVRGGEG